MTEVWLTYSPPRRVDAAPTDILSVTQWSDGWTSTTHVDGTTAWSAPRRHAGRRRGWRKFDDTRIQRMDRLRRRRRCVLTVGAFTMEPYCDTHGRAAGWPCREGHRSSLTQWPGYSAEWVLARLPTVTD